MQDISVGGGNIYGKKFFIVKSATEAIFNREEKILFLFGLRI